MSADAAGSQFVSLNGLRFHYLSWGDESAQPLLLLHGLSSNAHYWDIVGPSLGERYRVLALDQRGHGETAWAKDYAHDHMVEDIDAFVRAQGLRPFVLLGLSMGGRVAYSYAARHPDQVERLVIVDVGPDLAPAGAQRIRAAVAGPDIFADPEEAFRLARAASPRPTDEVIRERVRHGLRRLEDGTWTWRYDKGIRTGERPMERIDPTSAWAELAAIRCPTLVVRGDESDVLARETAERMRQVIANCRLVEVPDSGHPVPSDNPTGFVEALRGFI